MKSKLWVGTVLAVPILVYVIQGSRGEDTIEYRGQHFKMSKRYWSSEDYKDDPNNLDTNELPRIEKNMLDANIGPVFASREQFSHAVFGMKFPNYGLSSLGEKAQSDGSILILMSVEIPQRDKDSYFVARKTANSARLAPQGTPNHAMNEQVDLARRTESRTGSINRTAHSRVIFVPTDKPALFLGVGFRLTVPTAG